MKRYRVRPEVHRISAGDKDWAVIDTKPRGAVDDDDCEVLAIFTRKTHAVVFCKYMNEEL